jgi:DNA-binding response OmpR family regulator
MIEVSVSDTGLGIPPAEQEAIFDEFRQGERTTARGYGGLGLAICRRLVDLHGGEIGVRSSGGEGSGSTFYFTLPAMKESHDLEPASRQQETVLLFTERAGEGTRLAGHLRQRGFEVEECGPGVIADRLAGLPDAPPRAMVLDLKLASEKGWEILKTLKENSATRDVPVLFCSLAEKRGGPVLEMDYLTKPVGPVDLARALARQGLSEGDGKKKERTILVVDDDPAVLEMHARLVQAQLPTSRVLEARDGREGLRLVREELPDLVLPDLVLLDLMMPELDGFGVLEAMREGENTRDVPVIVLTAQVLAEEDMSRLNLGVAAVLGKGLFSAEETLAHVEAALARRPRLGSEMQRVVHRAMAYVHAHYADRISHEEVARHVGVSKRHLSRCFRQETGLSFMTYLVRYRVERAKELLAAGESVTEVSVAVGFANRSHFSRIFRREVGVVPSEYRGS